MAYSEYLTFVPNTTGIYPEASYYAWSEHFQTGWHEANYFVYLFDDNTYDFTAESWFGTSIFVHAGVDYDTVGLGLTYDFGGTSDAVITQWSPDWDGWFTVEVFHDAGSFFGDNNVLVTEIVGGDSDTTTTIPTTPTVEYTSGTSGADSMNLTSSADNYMMGDGADFVLAYGGDDIVYGNKENDTVLGGDGNDLIYLGQNDGPASAHPELAIVKQREGIERAHGGTGADTIYGNYGSDFIIGGDDADVLYGGQDADTLSGGEGADTLHGNRDADELIGGAGSDHFVWHPFTGGNDTITDFSTSEGDFIKVNAGFNYSIGTDSSGNVVITSDTSDDSLTLTGVTNVNTISDYIATF